MKLSILSLSFILHSSGASIVSRQAPRGTANVNFAQQTGAATFLGSGFIYGFPDNSVQADTTIPSDLITSIKFRTSRAGGAQLPSKGWAVGGYQGYIGRFNSTLSNYRTTRKYGGDFLLLPHDLWGADGGLGNGIYPGDNGDWSLMESFYKQLVSDLKANNMLPGLVFDIWNEPELDIFWARPWNQFLEYYVRAHQIIRRELPSTLISGPSGAHAPSLDRDTWNTWMAHALQNNAVPDIYSWHQIGSWERDPDRTIPDFNTLRARHGLPQRPIDVNEYAWPTEQNPGTSAWYLAQLERYNLRGLRANWGSGQGLHDTMANLVFRSGNTYRPNGEWYLYRHYANMTGNRVATVSSSDRLFDVFATVSGTVGKLIAGTRTIQGPYEIKVSGLTALGLPQQGSVRVSTLRFDWKGDKTDTGAPINLGVRQINYSGNTLTILQNPPSNSTAYAYEINGI